MSRITNYLTGSFLLFFLLSCTNDGNDKTGKTDSLNQLKEELRLEKFSNVNIAKNVEVNWSNAQQTEKKDVAIVEFDAKEKFPSKLQSSFLQAEMNYQLVSIESEGEQKNYFIEIFSYNDSDAYSKTITKLNKFKGVFNVFSLNGQNLGSIAINHGNARNISENKTLDFLAETINSFDASLDNTKKIPLCDGTYTQVVEQAQDRWRVVSLNGKILSVEYMDTVVTRTTTILPYPCDGSGDRDAIILQRTAHYYTDDGKSYAGISNLLETMMPPPPKLPISDIKKFLSCLNTTASANLTVYAEKTNLANANVGHAFISISQGNNVMIYGFYPENGYDKSFYGPGIMGENGEHAYDVSGNIGQITPQQLQKNIKIVGTI
ncbi:hypothetical protein [Flavobacterium anhuiense]|uniref:hypothetical protein n=1 Tax=Flavobacterium anhuiense TaxID=459526 RepID=UPI0020272E57|nr:hypothetical protein [Flavobacterium anhuiense]URM38215.1 hypothetical protein LLY39_06590 [Flavobacterium anhuiense]